MKKSLSFVAILVLCASASLADDAAIAGGRTGTWNCRGWKSPSKNNLQNR